MLCCSYHLIIFKRVPTELELKYHLYVLEVYVFIKAGMSVWMTKSFIFIYYF